MGCGTTSCKSYMIPDPYAKEIEGETVVHVNSLYPQVDKCIEEQQNDSMIDEIKKGLSKFADKDTLGYRKPTSATTVEQDFTYYKHKQIEEMSTNLSKHIASKKLFEVTQFEEEKGDWKIMGIFARNCVEWMITDLACQFNDITSVTFYSTLGPESFDHIFKQTNVSTIFISPESAAKLVEYHKQFNFSSLKNVVVFDMTLYIDKDNDLNLKEIKNLGLNLIYFSDLISKVDEDIKLNCAGPNSILTLCYTSGTTSLPKGAKLTQKGFASQLTFINDSGFNLNQKDYMLSYLPMAHVMERLTILNCIVKATYVGFISGTNIKEWIKNDIAALRPTIFVAVPRILMTFHAAIIDNLNKQTGCKKSLIDSALKSKRSNYEKNFDIHHWYYDMLVFKKVRNTFGGRIRAVITGSAPLPYDVTRDIKLFLCCPIIEGYGMTELHGASNATFYHDLSNKNVGGLLRGLKLKLVDQKALNYHSQTQFDGEKAPTGEICYYGPSVFTGYFRDPVNTASAIDEEGWLHTGDVGRIDPYNKGLKIIDRIKEIFKLSQGEYIAPTKLEAIYGKSPYVAQICIYGCSEKSYIIAIVVINKPKVIDFLKEQNIIKEDDELEANLKNSELLKEVEKNFKDLATQNKFSSLETARKFVLTTSEFTLQNDLLTPTMKLVRNKIKNFFNKEIDLVYES